MLRFVCTNRFAKNEHGTIAVIFAITLTVSIGMLALAIDLGNGFRKAADAQNALDSAALAAARAAATSTDTQTAGQQAAQTFWTKNKPTGVTATLAYVPSGDGRDHKLNAVLKMPLRFAPVMGLMKELTIRKTATATINPTTKEMRNIEVALVVDVSRSIYVTQWALVQQALRDFTQTLLGTPPAAGQTIKVALIPFADGVKLTEHNFTTMTGRWDNDQQIPSCYNTPPNLGGLKSTCRPPNPEKPLIHAKCARERPNDIEDAPNTTQPGTLYKSWNTANPYYDSPPTTCRPLQPAIWLSVGNKQELLTVIDGLDNTGTSSAGYVAHQMSWMALSPAFGGAPYNETKVRKVAIFVTDGLYNVSTGTSGPLAAAQVNGATAVCAKMLTRKIEIFVITVPPVASEAISNACATDEAHRYKPSDAAGVAIALRDVGLKIIGIVLSN